MEENTDPIVNVLENSLTAVKGGVGDIIIVVLLLMVVFCLFKKRVKMATGFFVLMLGSVFIRVLILNFF